MSYDVHLEIDLGGAAPVRVGNLEANHTYNTSGMISEAGGFGTLSEWDGAKAAVVAARCVIILREIRSTPEFYRKHEPDNKWGSLESTCAFLEEIRDACALAPTATFRVG